MSRSFRHWGLAGAVVMSGCGLMTAVEGEVPDPQTPSQIVITSEGGIAALRIRLRLDSLSRTVTRETCSLGASAAECQSRGQRQSVTVSAAEVADAFAATQTVAFRALRADYGTSTQGADLMGHRFAITANSRTRSIHGDDITLPQLPRDLHARLSGLMRD